jgi:hypothetical protein
MQAAITKIRQTKPQKKCIPWQKRDNIAGAFAANGDITASALITNG